MIVHEYRIGYKYGDTIKIKPLADVHLGNTYCDRGALRRYLQDRDDNTYLLGIGDLMDSIITKDMGRYEKHSDASPTDAIIDDQIDLMETYLQDYKGKIIGLHSGNHELTIAKYCGSHPMRRLCRRLDTKHLGYSSLVKLVFSENGSRGRTLIIKSSHGWGGGSRTMGADLTKFSRDLQYWDADMFLFGHVHRLQTDQIDRLSLVGNRLVSKPIHLMICGTFLKTLSETDEATYSEIKGYPPVKVGNITISVKPNKDWLEIKSDA